MSCYPPRVGDLKHLKHWTLYEDVECFKWCHVIPRELVIWLPEFPGALLAPVLIATLRQSEGGEIAFRITFSKKNWKQKLRWSEGSEKAFRNTFSKKKSLLLKQNICRTKGSPGHIFSWNSKLVKFNGLQTNENCATEKSCIENSFLYTQGLGDTGLVSEFSCCF